MNSGIQIKEILIQGRKGQDNPAVIAQNSDPVQHITHLIEAIAAHTVAHREPDAITRAITDEFSFYLKNAPLTVDEYKEIIKNTAQIASQLPPDTHLVLATFPVLWPDGGVHNCGLYVEAPKGPNEKATIHHFSKQHASDGDTVYCDANNVPIKNTSDADCTEKQKPNVVLEGTEVSLGDINQHGGALKVHTAKGKELIVVVGICMDHAMGVERGQVHGLIDQLNEHQQSVPLHCSHVITSASQNQYSFNTISSISHADSRADERAGPYPSRSGFTSSTIQSSFSGTLSTEIYPPKPIGTLHSDLFQHAITNDAASHLAADLNHPDADGNTMLHHVFLEVNFDRELLAKRLYAMIIHGGDPLLENHNHESIYDIANSIEQSEPSKIIIKAIDSALEWRKHLAEINVPPAINQRSALTQSVLDHDTQKIHDLVVSGANLYLKDGCGKSAMDLIKSEYTAEEQKNINSDLKLLLIHTQYGYVKQQDQFQDLNFESLNPRPFDIPLTSEQKRWFLPRSLEYFKINEINKIEDIEEKIEAYLQLFEEVEKHKGINREVMFPNATRLLVESIIALPSGEQRDRMFSADMLQRILNQIHTVDDLSSLMQSLSSEEHVAVFKIIANRFPDFIQATKNISDDIFLMQSVLSPEEFSLFIAATLTFIPDKIQLGGHIGLLEWLSPQDHSLVFLEIEHRLSQFFQSIDDFSTMMEFFTLKEITILFQKHKSAILSVLQSPSQLLKSLRRLPDEKFIFIFNELATDLPNLFKHNYGNLLLTLKTKNTIVMDAIKPSLLSIMKDFSTKNLQDFIDNSAFFSTMKTAADVNLLLHALTVEQCEAIAPSLGKVLERVVQSDENLDGLIQSLPQEKQTIILGVIKKEEPLVENTSASTRNYKAQVQQLNQSAPTSEKVALNLEETQAKHFGPNG